VKARAWHDRCVIRDIIDLHAAAGVFAFIDLERLGRRHEPDLDLEINPGSSRWRRRRP